MHVGLAVAAGLVEEDRSWPCLNINPTNLAVHDKFEGDGDVGHRRLAEISLRIVRQLQLVTVQIWLFHQLAIISRPGVDPSSATPACIAEIVRTNQGQILQSSNLCADRLPWHDSVDTS
jgi:hypothetical protein